MKHLPNLLTLGNLFFGCLAIVYVLTAQPYTSMNVESGLASWQWVYGAEQMYYGGIFICLAAVCDLLDGFTARALKVFSPIGKDLDSLADVVSFGVAPSVILFKFLWDAAMGERNAFDVSMLSLVPAFLVACFAALRLARFNITSSQQKTGFIGMPTPAAGLFVASLPLAVWSNPYSIVVHMSQRNNGWVPAWAAKLTMIAVSAQHMLKSFLQHRWYIYALIAVLCWLMVSKIRFIKLLPPADGRPFLVRFWPQLILITGGIVALPFLQFVAAPVVFLLYVLLSILQKHPETEQ